MLNVCYMINATLEKAIEMLCIVYDVRKLRISLKKIVANKMKNILIKLKIKIEVNRYFSTYKRN